MFPGRIFSPTWPFTRSEDTRAVGHVTLVTAEWDLLGWLLSVCSCSVLSSSLVSLSSTLPLSCRVRNVNCVRNEIAETWMCSHHPTHLSQQATALFNIFSPLQARVAVTLVAVGVRSSSLRSPSVPRVTGGCWVCLGAWHVSLVCAPWRGLVTQSVTRSRGNVPAGLVTVATSVTSAPGAEWRGHEDAGLALRTGRWRTQRPGSGVPEDVSVTRNAEAPGVSVCGAYASVVWDISRAPVTRVKRILVTCHIRHAPQPVQMARVVRGPRVRSMMAPTRVTVLRWGWDLDVNRGLMLAISPQLHFMETGPVSHWPASTSPASALTSNSSSGHLHVTASCSKLLASSGSGGCHAQITSHLRS